MKSDGIFNNSKEAGVMGAEAGEEDEGLESMGRDVAGAPTRNSLKY